MLRRGSIVALFLLQLICAVFLTYNIVTSVLGLPVTPVNWQVYELVEVGATLGLMLGMVLSGALLRNSLKRQAQAEETLRLASGAFMSVIDERFRDWDLTPAERDVALFSLKGLSTTEIATLRSTSEGTVKAQTNAIYRKAGVSGRPQLLSLFIDELMGDSLPGVPAPPS